MTEPTVEEQKETTPVPEEFNVSETQTQRTLKLLWMIDKKYTIREMAEKLGASQSTVSGWIEKIEVNPAETEDTEQALAKKYTLPGRKRARPGRRELTDKGRKYLDEWKDKIVWETDAAEPTV